MPTLAEIRTVPKVLLHDHLDGGLRPRTVLELAQETGYQGLPADNEEELTQRLTEGAHRGHLEIYLDAFRHTVGVMQTPDALRRVAAECAEDLAADGIVYAEVRFAPELHTERGLRLDEVVEAVLDGFRQGGEGRGITVYALLTAMRTAARSLEIAELAVRYRDRGVVGFDIAGAEAGWPPAGTLTRSSTSSGRTSTSRSTRGRGSGCRRSGRRCSGAAPNGWATASASWTTSRSARRATSGSGGCPPTSGTAGSRWRCARPRTCRPARRRRSRCTRSGCSASCHSGSR